MKKKILLISAAVIVLAAVCVIGYTLAYFTDTAEATNTFTIGNVGIKLDEQVITSTKDFDTGKWSYIEGTTRTEEGNNYLGVMPGAKLPKDPVVTNTGDNACYVQIEVTIPDGLIAFYPDYISFKISDESKAAWKYSEDASTEGIKLVYQYKSILAPGARTEELFSAIVISGDLDNDTMVELAKVLKDGNAFNMDIVAKAIQADGLTAEEAFAELNK